MLMGVRAHRSVNFDGSRKTIMKLSTLAVVQWQYMHSVSAFITMNGHRQALCLRDVTNFSVHPMTFDAHVSVGGLRNKKHEL